jgi:integrase
MNRFHSIFAERIASYVQLRRQLGLRFESQEAMLHSFDRYVHERDYQGPLSEPLARHFATSAAGSTTTIPARRYLVVRHFAEYLAAYDPSTPRLDPKAIFNRRQQPPPYIFTAAEIDELLRRATEIPQRHPVANLALRTMIGLAASTGLRPRELVGLDQADVDLETGILVIRRSKFDKDRLVPAHSSTLDVLRAYAAGREQMPGAAGETAFFLSTRTRRYQINNLDYLFRQLVRRLDLHSPRGRLPTFRSLRHTFAVRRLIAWYRAGVDVQALLPALATYMGHVHYTSTAYYLSATAELLGVAAERLVAPEVGHDQAT